MLADAAIIIGLAIITWLAWVTVRPYRCPFCLSRWNRCLPINSRCPDGAWYCYSPDGPPYR